MNNFCSFLLRMFPGLRFLLCLSQLSLVMPVIVILREGEKKLENGGINKLGKKRKEELH